MTDSTTLHLAPRVSPGILAPKTGGEIAFERVLVEVRNGGTAPVSGLQLKLEAHQGPELICELDEAMEGDLMPGAARAWDLYDLFLEKGHGLPSKVHMFGVKAALGWDFTVRASVGSAEAAFRFRWSGNPAGPITAAVEDLR